MLIYNNELICECYGYVYCIDNISSYIPVYAISIAQRCYIIIGSIACDNYISKIYMATHNSYFIYGKTLFIFYCSFEHKYIHNINIQKFTDNNVIKYKISPYNNIISVACKLAQRGFWNHYVQTSSKDIIYSYFVTTQR